MAERLVDRFFTAASIHNLCDAVGEIHPAFDRDPFLAAVLDDAWEGRSLMARLRHVAECLRAALPEDWRACVALIEQLGPAVAGFESMALPEIVGRYGLDDWDVSLPALAWLTRFGSSEFGIRPFLLADPARTMPWMERWAEDENEHVRRFASEGCRPRLPWGRALPAFKADPSPILPVLEKLKSDESEYVRRSVANNLNDIAKDHPDVTLAIGERWIGASKETDWIVRHACRSLLKAGEPRAMRLFGFEEPEGVTVERLAIEEPRPAIGEATHYGFEVVLAEGAPSLLRIDLAIDYVKARGHHSRKIFKAAEGSYAVPGTQAFRRKLNFRQRTTRTHYPGEHRLTVVVNGVEMATASFALRPEG